MLNWLKKETKEAIRAMELEDVKKRTDRSRKELALLPEPLDKLLKLERIIEKINRRITEKEAEILTKAREKGSRISTLSIAALAVSGILVVTTSSGLIIPAMLAITGIAGIAHFAPKVTASAKKLLESENFELMGSLNNQKATFLEIRDDLVQNNIIEAANAIIHNANFSSQKSPSIREAFTEVAAKIITEIDPKALAAVLSKLDNNSPKP